MRIPYETRMTVPTSQMNTVMRLLAERGCIVLDRGERVATDDGDDAEATLHVLFVDTAAALAEATGPEPQLA